MAATVKVLHPAALASAIMLLVVSAPATMASSADIVLSWGEIDTQGSQPLVSLFATSAVDIFTLEFICGYVFPDGTTTIGVESLFPQLLGGEIDNVFDFLQLDVDTDSIEATSSLGEPIPAGIYTLSKFSFPSSTFGIEFCIQSATFFNADLSISYSVEGPGCILLAEPDIMMKFRAPVIDPVENTLRVAVEAQVSRDVFGVQMKTEGSSDGDISSDSEANQYVDTLGGISQFLMVSFEGSFIPSGSYDNLIVFDFPLEEQGNLFCVVEGPENTVFSAALGEKLTYLGPGCLVLEPPPEACEFSGTGDINENGTLNVIDLISGRDIILGGVEADDCQLATLDVNLDNTSDVLDLVTITSMIVG